MHFISAYRRRTVAQIALSLGLAALGAFTVAPSVAAEAPAEWDGMARVASKRLEFVYVRPGASLAGYKRVRLDVVKVAFDKNWNPNRDTYSPSRRLTSTDLEAIKTNLATEFRKIFKDELAKGGYAVTESNGEDVLLVSPAIMDLYITAPTKPTAGRGQTYVTNAGRMTLVAELRDSTSGQMLARVVDRQQAAGSGGLESSNRSFNSAEARAIIGKWARVMRQGLDEVNDKKAQ